MSTDFRELIEHLRNVADKSTSIPAQLCGHAADIIEGFTKSDGGKLRAENEELRSRIGVLQGEIIRLQTQGTPLFNPGGLGVGVVPSAQYWQNPDGSIVIGGGSGQFTITAATTPKPKGGGYWIVDPVTNTRKWIPVR